METWIVLLNVSIGLLEMYRKLVPKCKQQIHLLMCGFLNETQYKNKNKREQRGYICVPASHQMLATSQSNQLRKHDLQREADIEKYVFCFVLIV